MSSVPVNRTVRRQRDSVNVPALPDVILRTESQGDLGDPGITVAEAEARAAITSRPNANCSKRTRANQLHREADQLYYKGDYESALVLYHRAARLCPREHSHSVAAWRIQTAISSAADPSRELSAQMKEVRSPSQMSALLCPEVAARRARDVVAESSDPVRDIPRILRFVESRKDFWRLSSPSTSPRPTRSKMMLKQLNRCVTSTLKELENAYEAGDTATVHELGDVLVNLATVSEEPNRNQLDLYSYLVSKQITLKRHDRAVNLAAKMIFLSRTYGNVLWMTEALVTIGKVHLAFGHLDALVQVWEHLVDNLEAEPIPQAWLYHDIGRCHLELGDFEKALDAAKLCLERANSVKSKKWMVRGHLLTGQSLLKLSEFGEAVVALKTAAIVALEEEDEKEQSIILYIQSLIDQVTDFLRQLNQDRDVKAKLRKSCSDITQVESSNSIRKNDDKQDADSQEESIHEDLPKEEKNPSKQRKRQHRTRTRLESQGDTSDEEKVAVLLEKTRSLRRAQSLLLTTASRDKGVKAPRPTAVTVSELLSGDTSEANGNDAADADLNLESSRTRIIRRCESERNSDDERTLKDDELLLLSDFSCVDDTGEEDFASARLDEDDMSDGDQAEAIQSGVNSPNTLWTAHPVVCEEGNEKSVSYFSPDEELTSPSISFSLDSENFASPTGENQNSVGMSSYLKGLKSHDFEELRKEECLFFEERSAD